MNRNSHFVVLAPPVVESGMRDMRLAQYIGFINQQNRGRPASRACQSFRGDFRGDGAGRRVAAGSACGRAFPALQRAGPGADPGASLGEVPPQ